MLEFFSFVSSSFWNCIMHICNNPVGLFAFSIMFFASIFSIFYEIVERRF